MWLAELITQRGIGQGMSILIFANVVASIPTGFKAIYEEGGKAKFVDHPRRLARLAGRHRLHGPGPAPDPGDLRPPGRGAAHVRRAATYIPLKVNQSGVIPIIFASSVLYIPVLLSNVIPWNGFQNFVRTNLTPTSFFYIAAYFLSSCCSPSSTSTSPSIRTSRPTSSASRAGSSPASGPARPPSGTSRTS